MRRRSNKNQTRRHRLIGHDYSEAGFYFVTFGTLGGAEDLGEIIDGSMTYSSTGQFIDDLLPNLPVEFPQMEIDSYAIMPNHVHILIYLAIDAEPPISISKIVRIIKGRTAAAHLTLAPNRTTLWHKGFHDVIVRNDQHLSEVRRYIAENTYLWEKDIF